MKLIGKGLFSKVYKLNEKQVLIKSTCNVKECLSLFVNEDAFPALERIDFQEYICEYFKPVKSLKNSLDDKHYKIYQELRKLSIDREKNKYDFADLWREQFKTITNKKYRTQILSVLDELLNYGTQVCFEISPSNVAVKNGKLILLDVFFMQDQRDEVWNSKKSHA